MSGGEPLLQVRELSKYFFSKRNFFSKNGSHLKKAVDKVSFDLYRGETLGLVGESGCGKTTLARLLVRLYFPDSGKVMFDKKSVLDLRNTELFWYRSKVQLLFQNPLAALNPLMKIEEIVAEPLEVHHLVNSKKEALDRAGQLLIEVGVPEYKWKDYPRTLSLGQLQRVCLARALILEPELLICDEPLSALDISSRGHILNFLKRWQKEKNISYLLICHDLESVRYLSQRVAVMKEGRIVELAETDTIFAHPSHPYTRLLLSYST